VDLYDVMRTTFAAREFTDESLPDPVLYRILDNARFAPSGGNRQAVHIIVVRDQQTRDRLAELSVPGARRYVAQLRIGEARWNPLRPSRVHPADVDTTDVPDAFIAPLRRASVVLVVCQDLRYVAATDQDLSRIGVVMAPRCTRSCGTSCWPHAARGTAATSRRW
jgi:nitroreductase